MTSQTCRAPAAAASADSAALSAFRVAPVVSQLACALACGSFAAACSGSYPLGETYDTPTLDVGDPSGSLMPSDPFDARVPAALAPPDVTINGEVGTLEDSLASVGDLDGDGRDEMVVSLTDWTAALSFVHLRYGGPRPSGADAAFAFERSGAYLTLDTGGGALAPVGVGDVNADGYEDLLIDTQQCDTTEPTEGAYLVYGGPERLEGTLSLTSLAAHFVPPAREGHPPPGYGFSCSGGRHAVRAGDLDGDGFDDLVLSRKPGSDTQNGTSNGRRPVPFLRASGALLGAGTIDRRRRLLSHCRGRRHVRAGGHRW